MKRPSLAYQWVCQWFIGLMWISLGAAANHPLITTHVDVSPFLPAESMQVNWIFSGLVASDTGEQFAYFFQMARDGREYHSLAALFDVQSQHLIFQDDSRGELRAAAGYNWAFGNAFLRFNPINSSWIVGVKTVDKRGFNFKIDMLQPSELIVREVRPGLVVDLSQANALNGHVYLSTGRRERFVMAKRTWFRQTTALPTLVTLAQPGESHALSGVLCDFEDGSGLYSMRDLAPDAVQGASAGWFNASGLPVSVSQFVDTQQAIDGSGSWDIRIPSPAVHLTLTAAIQRQGLIAGFAQTASQFAFCLLSQDPLELTRI